MTKPIVSVIVPVFGVERYLPGCLASIDSQSYRDIELILIDDGSTDGCGRICDEFSAGERDYPVIVVHQENRGLSAARNKGIDICRGDYILFVDGDDTIEPDMIETLVSCSEESGADISICSYRKVDDKGRIIGLCKCFLEQVSGEEASRMQLLGKINAGVWNKLYSKKIFDSGIRFPYGRVYEDTAIQYKLLSEAETVVGISYIGYNYLHNDKGISKTKSIVNMRDHWTACMERYRDGSALGEEYRSACVKVAVSVGCKLWRWSYASPKADRDSAGVLYDEVTAFFREHREDISGYPLWMRLNSALVMRGGDFSRLLCFLINSVYRPFGYLKRQLKLIRAAADKKEKDI